MSFTWPFAFLLLLAIPVVLVAYLLKMRRRRKQAVTYSSVALLRSIVPKRTRWRRHAPMGMLLASLGLLAIAAARPQMTQSVSTSHTSVILALDVSRSMCATDVDPNRITAAQQAAKDFVQHQPAGTRTGLIVFSGSAQLAVAPTTDRKALTQAIDGLSTGNGTAIGAAMLKSLDAIAEVNPNVKPVGDVPLPSGPDNSNGPASSTPAPTPAPAAPVARPGNQSYQPDIVVLLTDGANNRGIEPLDAVPYAVDRKVRIYTIGFGTTQIAPLACSAEQLGGDFQFGFGGGGGGGFGFNGGAGSPNFGGFGGGRSPLRADLPTLKEVADRTGGLAYTAQNASELRKVFTNLPRDVSVQKVRHEVSAPFALIGAVLAGLAIAASIKWSPYP